MSTLVVIVSKILMIYKKYVLFYVHAFFRVEKQSENY